MKPLTKKQTNKTNEMPYDVVGNAAGRSTNQAARDLGLDRGGSRVSRNVSHHPSHTNYRHSSTSSWRGSGGSTACQVLDCARVLFCFLFVGGGCMIFAGVSKLVSSTTDSRGALLSTWSHDVSEWTTTNSDVFQKLTPTLSTSKGTVKTGKCVHRSNNRYVPRFWIFSLSCLVLFGVVSPLLVLFFFFMPFCF